MHGPQSGMSFVYKFSDKVVGQYDMRCLPNNLSGRMTLNDEGKYTQGIFDGTTISFLRLQTPSRRTNSKRSKKNWVKK
ncbi:uncharacterized protein H6S33_007708 [Morchella sextelata]|uniref:uncharacterized protein n=1 Tax=Morchella sextelata TaxID=1174677 RepID=UPI001D03642A|nr:uncharacterized protein H6S33_007708 [Morchella sextelata]KAH0603386.1 hypothetical protein H6S33_007708 [Morchella sextelata]